MADLNGLKIINDSYGHEKGDEILIKAAEILKGFPERRGYSGKAGWR